MRTRTRNILIGAAILAVPLIAFAYWLLAPLFIDTTVTEEFPMSANAEMPAGVTQREAEDAMAVMAKIDMPAMEAMPADMPQASVIASGMFRDGDSFHKGKGDAAIYRLPDGAAVLRFEGLDVTNGPDLHVLAVSHPAPMGRSDVHDGGYTDLGQLKGNRGDQNYDIPADLDLGEVRSIVIYCMPFHVVFSVAPLSAP